MMVCQWGKCTGLEEGLLGLSQWGWNRSKERSDSEKPFKGDADFVSKCDREGSKEE